MTIQFLLQDLPLGRDEVLALMEPELNTSAKPVRIELSDYITGNFKDSQKLFEMAIKNNNKGLVDIAWKIAMKKDSSTKNSSDEDKSYKKSKILKACERPIESVEVEDLIEKLNSHSSNWATGAAMLLRATSKGEWKTLKQIACDFINENTFNPNSANYRGFELNRYNGLFEPRELRSGVDRKTTFHVSPLYIGLREGLMWCKTHNLINQKNQISFGSNSESNKSPGQMQRVYYSVKANDRGEKLVKMWADIDDYIQKFCRAR